MGLKLRPGHPRPVPCPGEAPLSDRTPKNQKASRAPTKTALKRHRALGGELKGRNLREEIAANVYRIRRGLDLTQDEISLRVGIDAGLIGAIERAERNITVDSLSNLAAAYSVEPDDLIRAPKHQKAIPDGLTLGILANITRAIDERVQHLLLRKGDVPVGKEALASVVSALFDALADGERYHSRP